MSEFKYACPVCGQHIKCDSSQSGSVMECPTCFQKIVAPQAPENPDPKFILTGQKFTQKKIPTILANAPTAAAPAKSFPTALFIFVVFVAVAGAGLFAFRGKIFRSPEAATPPETTMPATNAAAPAAKPALVAPPANDTNWLLNLDAVQVPDSTVAGRIHGQDFICERATFQNGTLILRSGSNKTLEFGVIIDFSGALAEALAGKTINIATNIEQAAKITLRWQENGQTSKAFYANGYALRLTFGALEKNRLPGKIYLCLPDAEKSYLLGTFNADARKPKPKKTQP